MVQYIKFRQNASLGSRDAVQSKKDSKDQESIQSSLLNEKVDIQCVAMYDIEN